MFGRPLPRLVPDIAALLLIVGAVAGIYGQVLGHQFVAWDDTSYISENHRVLQGLTWHNVIWAFGSFQLSNWHPLTLLSHMIDVSLWGVRPGLHAFVNVAIHAINAFLLYLLSCRVSAELRHEPLPAWIAGVVLALFFAVHPLHVESVAWISQRKDLLCAFFWLLTLHAYLGYVRYPSSIRYFAVTLWIALALLAKPMAVTLPLVLLIFDWWPLRRTAVEWSPATRRLLYEKLPWLGLSLAVGSLTLMAQSQAMPSFSIAERAQVALVAYGWYIEKTFLPLGLHFYYLTEGAWDTGRLIVSLLVIALVTTVSYRWRKRRPEWLAGWLWFLLTLLPVVGFIKVGTQAWADRYAYVPHIGLFCLLIGLASTYLTTPTRRRLGGVLVAAMVGWLYSISAMQVAVWKDTTTLYRHALAQNPAHYVALMGLANQALREKKYAVAEEFAKSALGLSGGPGLVRSMNGVLGEIALASGDISAAITHFESGRYADDIDDGIRTKLGFAYLTAGRFSDAESSFRDALKRNAESVEAMNGLGVVIGMQGRMTEAYNVFAAAVVLAPWHRGLRHNLAATVLQTGDVNLAKSIYRDLLAIYPDDGIAKKALADLSAPNG